MTRTAGASTDSFGTRRGLRLRPDRPLRAMAGGAIVIASFATGAAIVADAATEHDVLVLATDIEPGHQISREDVRVISLAWNETVPAYPADAVDAVVGRYARYRLAANALLSPDDLQSRPLVSASRVLMSITTPASRVPDGLTVDSRVWLIARADAACAAPPVLVDATVMSAPRQDQPAGDNRSVAMSVEVPTQFVAAVGSADSISLALWSRDATPPTPPPPPDAPSACAAGSASSGPVGTSNPDDAPAATGTFIIDGSDLTIPPTTTVP